MHAFRSSLVCLALASCQVQVGSQPPVGGLSFPIGSAGGRMLSSDGVMLATFAPGSGAPASVTVAPADLATLKASFTEHEILAAYELGPTGSTFSPAVVIEMDVSRIAGLARDAELLLWRSEGSEFVLASRMAIVDDGPGGAFVVRGEVPHFSTVVLTQGREMRLSFESDDFADVGQPVASVGHLTATAASQANALGVVMHADAGGALTQGRQSRDFGALLGGATSVDRPYDPVTCARAGIGVFTLDALFTAYSNIRNGERTPPTDVERPGSKRVFCHNTTGTDTVGGPGTGYGGNAQTMTVSQPTVRVPVGQKFVLEVTLSGRTGAQGIAIEVAFPGVVSDAVAANPAAVGAATNVSVRPTGSTFTLAGTGGVRLEFECLRVGETGLNFRTTHDWHSNVTTRVSCIAPPPPEEGDGH